MTLTEYCTGIADAIREVEGSTEAIPAPDHAARIKALSSGSDFVEVTLIGRGTFNYVDENGVCQSLSLATAEEVTVKAYKGVIGYSTTGASIACTGDYISFNPYGVTIFESDGGTIMYD